MRRLLMAGVLALSVGSVLAAYDNSSRLDRFSRDVEAAGPPLDDTALMAAGVSASTVDQLDGIDSETVPEHLAAPTHTPTPVRTPTLTPTLIRTPTPTPTPQIGRTVSPTPTATSTVTRTPTRTPIVVVTATPTSPPDTGNTIDGVPVCQQNDQTTWHPAVQYNADGSIKCTFGEEHGDNPHLLDKTFGPMGAWWNNGVEHDISYPWETMNENETKHSAYKIIVRGSDTQWLLPWYTIGGQNYIRAFRGEYHLDGPKGFVMSQYHSFSFEAQVCSPDGNCGIARFGGVQDLGERLLTHDDGSYTCLFNNLSQPLDKGICNGGPAVGPRTMAGGPESSRRDETWYGSNSAYHNKNMGLGGIGLDFGVIMRSVWGPIHPASPMDADSPDPAVRGDYPPHYKQEPYVPQNVDDWHHDTSVEVSALNMSFAFGSGGKIRVTTSGYTDRYGNAVRGCARMGPDCVPFQLTNVPTGLVGFRDAEYERDTGRPTQVRNHDVVNPKTGHSLVIWPN